MLEALQQQATRLLEPGAWLDILAGAVGVGATVVPDGFLIYSGRFRAVFGDNSGGKGSLTLLQVIGRGGLYLAEVVTGMAVAAESSGPLAVGGAAFSGAAGWHALRMLKTNYIGTQPILGIAF